ncbi:hypothetical protein D3C78_1770470 [compost metagenome]
MVQRQIQFGDQLAVQGVERVGAVQGDQADAPLYLKEQGFKFHIDFSRCRPVPCGTGLAGYLRVMVVLTGPPTSSSSNQRWVTVLVWV